MPNDATQQQAAPISQTELYKKLIRTKCPETFESPGPQVFASILISMSERTDRLERENRTLKKSVGMMARLLHALTTEAPDAEGEEQEAAVEEDEEPGRTDASTSTAGGAGGGSTPAPQRDERYNQPFPEGVSATVAGGAAAAPKGPPVAAAAGTPNKTGPVDDVDVQDLTPNIPGSPAINPQPIPKGPTGPNGRRGANA